MANPDPSPKGRFQPGQSGNPSGRPKTLLTRDQVKHIIGTYAKGTLGDINAALENPKTVVLDAIVCSILKHAVQNGDPTRLNYLLDRCIGKVADELQIDDKRDLNAELQEIPKEAIMEVVERMKAA